MPWARQFRLTVDGRVNLRRSHCSRLVGQMMPELMFVCSVIWAVSKTGCLLVAEARDESRWDDEEQSCVKLPIVACRESSDRRVKWAGVGAGARACPATFVAFPASCWQCQVLLLAAVLRPLTASEFAPHPSSTRYEHVKSPDVCPTDAGRCISQQSLDLIVEPHRTVVFRGV